MAQPVTLVRPPLQDATKQIRLLQLQLDDRRGRGDRVIQCTLDVHSLEDVVGQYVAVSYTWGEADETHTVLVNGQKCQVRYNCWQALDQLKRHGISEYCFVDSICIDQGSHREKRQQVGQMSTIYSGAKFVAASLGGKAGGQEKAMRLFSSDMLSLRADPKEWVQMLHHISERRYFTRVWTTQECILAQRVEFFCGRSRVPLDTLETKLKQQTRAVLGLAMLTQLTSFLDDCSRLRGQQSDLRALSLCNSVAHRTSLLHPATAIIRYGVRECVDPRDKIFGLHSLMSPAARERIDIDYELPLFDVLLKYIDSHEYLVDQNAHEALDTGNGDRLLDATSLGEAMLSIRLLAHQFAATSPEFRRFLKDFCSRKIKRYDHRRGTPETNIPVVICPALYHNITTESHVANEGCDMILRSDQGGRLLQRGLRPVVSQPSFEGDWNFHQACSCCETERPQFTKAHSKNLACVRASSNYSNFRTSLDPHKLLYKRHKDNDAGLVFQVPKDTSNGDILLFIGSYNPTSETQKSFRQFLVCRKKPNSYHGYQILGPASHRATINAGSGETLSFGAYAHRWSYGLQKRAMISREDLLALSLTTREELITSKFEKNGYHDRLNMISLRMPERRQEAQVILEMEQHVAEFLGYDALEQLAGLESA